MPTTFTVSTAVELQSALNQAGGGDVIRLQSGDYGNVFLRETATANLQYDTPVTIVSADPGNPAVFTGMDMRDARNITIEGVDFDYRFAAGDQIWNAPFSFMGCENLTIRNSRFEGDVARDTSTGDDGFAFAIGLSIRGGSGAVIEDNVFSDFHRGVTVMESGDVTVRGNDIHSMRSDGLNFIAVQGVTIEGNHIHDFGGAPGSSDHRDFIQFWTNGTTTPSTDIVIRGNILDIGEGDWAQSIFMRNEEVDLGRAGAEMFYRNVLIENNLIVNGHLHGITVGETDGLIIRNNSVLHADGRANDGADSTVEIPRIGVSPTAVNVLITDNITSTISGFTGQAGWVIGQNAFVQDQNPEMSGWYGDVFLSSSLQPVDGRHAYILIPGSPIAVSSAGADATRPDLTGVLLAQFHVTTVADDAAARMFDARFAGVPEGTVFTWDFGDGTSAEGRLVNHTYTAGGMQEVRLTLTLPDGSVAAARLNVGIAGPDVITQDAEGFRTWSFGQPDSLIAAGTAEGLQLGATAVAARIGLVHVADIATADEVDIGFTLKADTISTWGEVFRLHGTMVASVNSAGNLVFALTGTDGQVHVITATGVNVSDGAAHDISISFSEGAIRVTVDSVETSAAFTGRPALLNQHDLTFGYPWGGTNFHGDLTGFRINTDASDYPAAPSTVVLPDDGSTPLPGGVDDGQLWILYGGTGDDVFVLDTRRIAIQDQGGLDTAESGVRSIDLSTRGFGDIEHVVLSGAGDFDATGNAAGNRLYGNAGDNRIDGGAGTDSMAGGLGNDTYVVDAAGDSVTDSDGVDLVEAWVSHDLAAGIENATARGNEDIALAGNALDNRITGNAGDNVLNGGAGADTLTGGGGNDTYILDDRADRVLDSAGWDVVHTSAGGEMAGGVESAFLTGTAAISILGNARDNRITGNAAANRIDGGAGDDTMIGGRGNDTYVVNHHGDRVVDSAGWDHVLTSIGGTVFNGIDATTLTGEAEVGLNGNALANRMTGNDGNNRLHGGAGNDSIAGGRGADTLTGGANNDRLQGDAGADIFVFHANHGRDTINDFEARRTIHDVLDLRRMTDIVSLWDLRQNHMRQDGQDLVITGNDTVIRLTNVATTDLDWRDVWL